MKVSGKPYITRPSFKGTTALRALNDSHQESRLECELLTKIGKDAEKQNRIIGLLDNFFDRAER